MIFRSPSPDIELPQLSVCDKVLAAAKQFGDKPAIIEGETGRTLRREVGREITANAPT